MGLLEGKVAIVTGAGRGLGRAEALELARHGAKVVVNDVGGGFDGKGEHHGPADEVVEEIRRMGGEAVPSYESVSDFEGARRIVERAVESFGRLDILVNNAGILRDRMIFNMTEEDWDLVMDVHLKGTSTAPITPAPTGGNSTRRVSPSPAGSSTRPRTRACSTTRARATTGPPRPASWPSPSSWPRRCRGMG